MQHKTILTLALFLLFTVTLLAQTGIEKQTFTYAINGSDTLRLDKYNDIGIKGQKPCVIFVFGGGFVSGARDAEHNVEYMQRLAQNGYVAISIDYRLGLKDITSNTVGGNKEMVALFENTINMAVEDLFSATAYVYSNANDWGIDREMIVANGSSAGAVTVLQAEYYICNKNGLTQKLPEGFNYAGIIGFAGAIYSNSGKPKWETAPCPIQMFHGDADSNVPFSKVKLLKYGLFGSEFIAEQLGKMNSPYYFYRVENAAHEIAGTPMVDNITDINGFIQAYVINKKPLQITTIVKRLDKPDVKKKFKVKDYLKANFSI